jgi:hypothetical protein
MIRPLTEREEAMLRESAAGVDPRTSGFGVELIGAGAWSVARRLVARELGWIENGKPNGSSLPGLFFANVDGVTMVSDEDDPHSRMCCCPECVG